MSPEDQPSLSRTGRTSLDPCSAPGGTGWRDTADTRALAALLALSLAVVLLAPGPWQALAGLVVVGVGSGLTRRRRRARAWDRELAVAFQAGEREAVPRRRTL